MGIPRCLLLGLNIQGSSMAAYTKRVTVNYLNLCVKACTFHLDYHDIKYTCFETYLVCLVLLEIGALTKLETPKTTKCVVHFVTTSRLALNKGNGIT